MIPTHPKQATDQPQAPAPDCKQLRELPLAALLYYAIVGDGPGRGMKPLAFS